MSLTDAGMTGASFRIIATPFWGVLAGKFGAEEVPVIQGHGQREDGAAVAIFPHAHRHARSTGAECGLPRSDRQAAWRGGWCDDIREMHLDIGFARLGECTLGGHAAFIEAGGVDDVCVRRMGAFVNELENGPLVV